MTFSRLALLITMFFGSTLAHGELFVLTTTTDLSWAAKKIGGDRVKVKSLLNGNEDPHYVDAVPSFVALAAKADVFCLVGLDLEVAWVGKVLKKAGNASVQKGGKGYCETGSKVEALERPKGPIDRSMGDVHASGNPHYHLSPKHFIQGASVILATLIAVDPSGKETYQKGHTAFLSDLRQIEKKVTKILAPIKESSTFLEYHKEFTYFFEHFGLKTTDPIESVPGVPPSAGQLANSAFQAKQKGAISAIASPSAPKAILKKFTEISKVPVVTAAPSIKRNGVPSNYEDLLVRIATALLSHERS